MTLPTDLTNLLFWYKADAITGLTNGQALNTNATLWPDSGPNAWHITSFAATCPTWTASATNGLPAVYFGLAGSGLLTLPSAALSAFSSKPGATVYAVLGGVNGANIEWLNAKTGTSTKGRLVCLRDSSGNLGFEGRRLDTDSIVTLSDASNAFSAGWNITTVLTDWTNNKVGSRLNGGTATSHTSVWPSGGNSDANASTSIAVGGDSNGNSNMWAGSIAEIFAFDRVLTSTEQAQMDSYLSSRWGIAVADGTVASVDSGTIADVSAVDTGTKSGTDTVALADVSAVNTPLASTDSATLGETSSLAPATSDTVTLADITNDILISDSSVEVTLGEVSSLGSTNVTGIDSATVGEVSASSATPAVSDGFIFSDLSAVAVLSTSPSSSDLFTITDSSALATSLAISTTDGGFLADLSAIVEAAFAHQARGLATIQTPRGMVTIGGTP